MSWHACSSDHGQYLHNSDSYSHDCSRLFHFRLEVCTYLQLNCVEFPIIKKLTKIFYKKFNKFFTKIFLKQCFKFFVLYQIFPTFFAKTCSFAAAASTSASRGAAASQLLYTSRLCYILFSAVKGRLVFPTSGYSLIRVQ